MDTARPQVTLAICEQSDTQVVFAVYCPTTNSAPVQDLSFKFDVPGDYLTSDVTWKDRMESCQVLGSFKMLDNGDTVAETVYVHCKSILPHGFARGIITFDRTRIRPVPGSVEHGFTNMLYMPLMDLHDYSPCLFTWSHKGAPQLEQFYLSLTNLSYIREDNANLIKVFRNDDFYRRIQQQTGRTVTNPSAGKFTEAWLRDMEEKRKNW